MGSGSLLSAVLLFGGLCGSVVARIGELFIQARQAARGEKPNQSLQTGSPVSADWVFSCFSMWPLVLPSLSLPLHLPFSIVYMQWAASCRGRAGDGGELAAGPSVQALLLADQRAGSLMASV